ncbi:TetR/AcrR family transcriptional regulator [Streptacidiphilus sp. PB12-B1b]|uniref:TetR/AcrR family transcriptional regulator n=1 Tax=Streptacidiphilus sp. PB12-B1b TaxID=2705012 RepID=UPI0015F7C0F3|nr:TetR/AcrR family transcriptional regulator [Streptacidiphilus sp. PB12-B1b]QMU77455.1 TetR/AcrR family transcriptional regulator [Streptacidiphilus sp. PB12-B1b]
MPSRTAPGHSADPEAAPEAAPGTAAGHRAPQQDRSRATRQRLLEAAVECLVEFGWTGTTVTVVAERAGVSRGAAQHHFPTREALTTAAVAHLTESRTAGIQRELDALAPPAGGLRTEAVVELIVSWFTGVPFRAALELWVAASSDPHLRELVVPLEARTGRKVHQAAVELLGVDETAPGVREIIQATLDMARGLGLANLLTDDSRRRRGIIREWSRVLDAALAPAGH